MSLLDRFRQRATEPQPAIEPVRFPELPLRYPDDVMRVPVAVVSYFPAVNGRIRRAETGDVDTSIEAAQRHTRDITQKVAATLELGSVYHGYRDPAAQPSLRYEIVEEIELIEPLPTWSKAGHSVPMTDYTAIVERIGGRSLVMERGVKEIWLWGYHGGVVDLWESNMAGPYGDISNSDRDPNDLPIFDRTYTLYHYNYGRGASEAIEDHIHQIEAVLREVDPHLFWDKFVGRPDEGRCGWAHYPPNGVRDYDWANPKRVSTDIEEWSPDGGPRRSLNADRWHRDSLTWFTYWMENLPGRGNALSYRGRALSNWWTFIGDFDRAMASGMGLAG
jgi:hypothetical protein